MSNNKEKEDEVKRKRQKKKMTRVLGKIWGLDGSQPFQQVATHKSTNDEEGPMDLTTMGQNLENGVYANRKHGWKHFAVDIGLVYNRFIISGKKTKLAKQHLEKVGFFLGEINPNLTTVAMESHPKDEIPVANAKKRKGREENNNEKRGGKIRKQNDMHVPKKKGSDNNHQASKSEHLTLTQREAKGMEALNEYVIKCGGGTEQCNSFRCKVTQSGDRFNTLYLSQGRRFRSMPDVARFLDLIDKPSATPSKGSKRRKPRNNRELETERRKLTKELDKLMRNHAKATKALDNFRTEKEQGTNLVEEEFLEEDGGEARTKALLNVLSKPDMDSFPGLPQQCIPDVLMTWDFLCTFCRTLKLEPIGLEEFAASLIYEPPVSGSFVDHITTPITPPLYLAEAHQALITLLLSNRSSDDWWWSTLETAETEAGDAKDGKTNSDATIIPTIKVDIVALLDTEEDLGITKKWLQALEDVRTRRANNGNAIKSAVKSAISITTNGLVKTYLQKSMRQWKNNSAGSTKQAVEWLVGRVREARPDLWGRKVSKEAVIEQKMRVARDAAALIEKLDDEPDIENVDDLHFGDSDEDSDEEDDDNLDDQDDTTFQNGSNGEATKKMDDTTALVQTSIPIKPPPSIVDLLLPPGKPFAKSDLVSPFTWPFLAGASACRIVHRYRRLQNEVDDNLREFNDIGPLTVAERRRREAIAPFRILSECFSTECDNGISPVTSAIDKLCDGQNYLSLSPVERLCILRILVEASYDTEEIYQCVQDNIKSKISAVKQLESEERRLKKEAKMDTVELESEARERLAREAKEEFLMKKRREIVRTNRSTMEFSEAEIRDFTEEDIVELFDDETNTEYKALPSPQNFTKNEVATMVTKINEEAAFGTTALAVITMEELQSRESNELASMEDELASYGDANSVYQVGNRETSAKVEKLKREIGSFKDWMQSLPGQRGEAIEALKDAIEDGTSKALRAAIKDAKEALLIGDEEGGGLFALDLLRDAALELKAAEKRKRVTEAQRDLVAKKNKCFVRTEPVGIDRTYSKYWQFDHDDSGRLWNEVNYRIQSTNNENSGSNILSIDSTRASAGAKDEEEDIVRKHISKDDQDAFLSFSRKEYHPSGSFSSLVNRHHGYLSSIDSIRSLVKVLDGRGAKEGPLKGSIKEILEAKLAVPGEENDDGQLVKSEGTTSENSSVRKEGDESVFQKALANYLHMEPPDSAAYKHISSMKSAIGQRFRLRTIFDYANMPDFAEYRMGTIIGWTVKSNVQNNEESPEIQDDGDFPVWHLSLDKGGEEEIQSSSLIDGLLRSYKWKNHSSGYTESDSQLFTYRNKVGRFCGKAADAPYAASAESLSRLIVKREQELYLKLKNRNYDNTWGGKSGMRNTWITSMKDYADNIDSVREGLLTLENALNELCGEMDVDNPDTSARSGKELLQDTEYRFEIELESIENIQGLWRSQESRIIFREILNSCTSLGLMALCLDLLCRNCQAYLVRTKPTMTRNSYNESSLYGQSAGRVTRSSTNSYYEQPEEQPRTTRRMNAWQQQNSSSYY